MSRKIFLSNGDVALVSDEDHIFLAGYNWHQHKKGRVLGRINGKHQWIHRAVAKRMGLDLSNQIDHKDGNPLNNCRDNLRSATNAQNRANSRIRKSKSGFKGVVRKCNCWQAQITVNKEKIYLGSFDTPEEAHEAYCEAAVKYHGEFANFGIID